MINLELTEQELNTILQGLYLLEDQSWFYGKDKTDALILKLDTIQKMYSKFHSSPMDSKNKSICDI